jgi:hypothetical protein
MEYKETLLYIRNELKGLKTLVLINIKKDIARYAWEYFSLLRRYIIIWWYKRRVFIVYSRGERKDDNTFELWINVLPLFTWY